METPAIVPATATFQIFARNMGGKLQPFQVSSETTIGQLKDTFAKQFGIPKDQQRLVLGGKELDNNKKMADCGVKPNNTVDLITRLRGG